MLSRLLVIFVFFCSLFSAANASQGKIETELPKNGVVILQYHHVSDTTPKSTSVTPAQFTEQMTYLADNNFNVIPLSEAINSIKNKQALPDKTIAITFDDGYKDIAQNAHPILKTFGFPYTLFVAVAPIKHGYGDMMTWEQLTTLAKDGAEIANHSWNHEHLIDRNPEESKEAWLKRTENNILKTENAIKEATGQNLKILAYPYGEYNMALQQLLMKHGYTAVGQQSGAAGIYSELTALPRFPVAGPYADLASLKVKMHSLNMPVLRQNITDPQLKDGNWRPELKVKLNMSDIYPHQLMCFIQGQGAKQPLWINKDEFSIQADLDLPVGRSRYNCTVPSKTKGSYYWFSQAWVRK